MAKKKGSKKPKFDSEIVFPLTGVLYAKMQEYAAWFSGEPDLLCEFYRIGKTENVFGTVFTLSEKTFWAKQTSSNTVSLHVPMAGSISELSSDLLFSEKPAINLDEAQKEGASDELKASQDELDTLLEDVELNMKCIIGAETAAAMGGVYLKIALADTLVERPIIEIQQPDTALPVFSHGILAQVSFPNIVAVKRVGTKDADKSSTFKVFRLMETYTSDGKILYSLYKGNHTKLGKEVSITVLEQTKLMKDVDLGIDRLGCVYVPNMLPNRISRDSSLGRSDYQGLEPLMSSLDETYSSWQRDIELSKAKIMIPTEFLEPREQVGNVDKEYVYDKDTAIYARLNVDPLNETFTIQAIQFKIRADEFEKTCLNLIERIASGAGYSPQSFGLNIQGRVESGDGMKEREKRTNAKKVKKEAFWRKPLTELASIIVSINNKRFGGTIKEGKISVEFSKGISPGLKEVSEALAKIKTAAAASTFIMIKMLHPDWTEEQIEAEVARIKVDTAEPELNDPDMDEEYSKYKANQKKLEEQAGKEDLDNK